MFLSIITPEYKGEKMLEELVSRIKKSVEPITSDYEIILVNDCSPDGVWDKIKLLCANDKKIKGINLSRNFGQHYAITAGLLKSSGEWIVVMDCDLQDRPEEIPNLFAKAQEGYDTVFAQRIVRHDSFYKKMSSQFYHYVFDFLTGQKSDNTVANYGIFHRKVINAVLSMGDSIRSFPTMVRWVGFRQAALPVQHAERGEGTSGYNVFKLFRLAGNNIVNFSNRPLLHVLRFGFFVVFMSFFLACYYFVCYFVGVKELSGFTTLVISIWLVGGLLMLVVGVVGIYISKIFERVKGRPVFVIGEELNLDNNGIDI